jgi:ribosomal protein S18 acetylase RimI-like enzyme
MITRVSQATPAVLDQVSNFVVENRNYIRENFPQCESTEEITETLRKAGTNWNVLVVDSPVALFLLQSSDSVVQFSRLCMKLQTTLENLMPTLQSDLRNMRAEPSAFFVPEEYEQTFSKAGYQRADILTTFLRKVTETQLMPILPMSNPGRKDIPALARLMLESYANSKQQTSKEIRHAETRLQDVIKGTHGTFLSEASFIVSGTQGNLVSACFITSELPRVARVVQLFTHPLYRARGLATTELAMGMNQLIRLGVHNLTAPVPQNNDVALRLFAKLGFDRGQTVVEMTPPLMRK